MDSETARIEHLKIIQVVIERMGRYSHAIKAGTMTLSLGVLAVSFGIESWPISAVGILPIIVLWGLDAFFIKKDYLDYCTTVIVSGHHRTSVLKIIFR